LVKKSHFIFQNKGVIIAIRLASVQTWDLVVLVLDPIKACWGILEQEIFFSTPTIITSPQHYFKYSHFTLV
jgi:hypothetical protein